jgi:protein-serine/threonine kinase
LLCDSSNRLKSNEIRSHPFFRGIDWISLRRQRAPFIPQLKSITDTTYFPTEELSGVPEQVQMSGDGTESGEEANLFSSLAFVGYTFRRWDTYRESL